MWWSADGHPNPPCSSVAQLQGDVRCGVTRADHQYVAFGEGPRVAVGRRMQNLSAEGLTAGPRRQPRAVIVAGRDDHRLGGQLLSIGDDAPAIATAVQPLDSHSKGQSHALASHVIVE